MLEALFVEKKMDSFGLQRRYNIWLLPERQIRDLVLHIGEVALQHRKKKAYGGIGHIYRRTSAIY